MGCRLTVLIHSLISLGCPSPDTFIGCNYGKPIPSTLTPMQKAFMIHVSSSPKRKTELRWCFFPLSGHTD